MNALLGVIVWDLQTILIAIIIVGAALAVTYLILKGMGGRDPSRCHQGFLDMRFGGLWHPGHPLSVQFVRRSGLIPTKS